MTEEKIEHVYYCPHCCKFFIGKKSGEFHRHRLNHKVKEVTDIELKERVIANQT